LPHRAPSFKGLKPASSESSRIKRANGAANTRHELILCRHLRRLGLRYRSNVHDLPGKPDIAFPVVKIAVFCDGDFWHGRKWQNLRKKLGVGANSRYWTAKIAANRKRDKRVNAELRKAGWRVLRFWETNILRNPTRAAEKIHLIVVSQLRSPGSCE
jgi:DNA mismatch endonuclease (patch repair protein)